MIAQVNTYMTNYYDGMTPEQLILLLFKGALDRIELARQGIKENNPRKRGENLGKVIAIVSELNTSVNTEMQDEGTRFLRGLYGAILVELPKVSISNDISILDRTEKYITRLKDIWESDVMHKPRQVEEAVPKEKRAEPATIKRSIPPAPMPNVAAYGGQGSVKRLNSFSV
ncbi:flagellar export chaperone FliS [Desulfobacter latus]|uniref:Flagellar export chaperone FliS n=1 Tax=Desulfobacter latus TaxID=2292 RepID=A0A850T9R3_9BACT|nr:flagellar export chaperone FliS [Desulfobacter latus]NWH04947.1 flagellar export chaperone FliS [Desulfobacter latus]